MFRIVVMSALLVLALSAPGSAQLAAGWAVGGSTVSELNPDASGSVDLAPDMGAVLGLHVDRWYGASERFAARFQVGWVRPSFDWVQGERKIDAFSGDVSVLARLLVPEPGQDFEFLPYVALGFGGVWYDLGRGSETTFPQAGVYHDGSTVVVPAAVFGGGIDLGIPYGWFGNPVRIRLEVADHYALNSPFRNLATESREGAVHNLRFTIGAYSVTDLVRFR